MKRSKRMESIVKLAANEEKQAVARMSQAAANLEKKQATLLELEHYKLEYSQKMQLTKGNSIGVQALRRYHAFLASIEQGIAQQQQEVQKAQQAYEQARQEWMRFRTRTKALDTAMQNCRREERTQETKGQQKIMDEFSARMGRRGKKRQ